MCDVPEEELAEYLRWLERAEARARAVARTARSPGLPGPERPPEPVLADA